MAIIEEVADGLARRALEVIEKTGDDTIEKKVAETIANASPTLQEAFATAMRIRRGERRAFELLDAVEKRGG